MTATVTRIFVLCVLALVGLPLTHGGFNETYASRKKSGSGDSTCICTTTACPVAGSNELTEGDGLVGVYEYALHGSQPVVVSAKATITKADLDKGTDTVKCTQDYARMMDDDGSVDADAGHILAHRLGGLGSSPINIFPQDLSINRGVYAQFENKIYDCVTSGASSADLFWTFHYSSSSKTKPDKVVYNAKFHGGSCTTLAETFTNGR